MSNVLNPKPRPEFSGYTHSFQPTFNFDGAAYDRLSFIERHGIVSPNEAKRRGIPYFQNFRGRVAGAPEGLYDDVIFLFPIKSSSIVRGPNAVTLLISPAVAVLTPEEMKAAYPGWFKGSIFRGEVYALGSIKLEDIVGVLK